MLWTLTRLVKDEEGVTAVEYGLIAALVAVVIITAVSLLGTNLSTLFSTGRHHHLTVEQKSAAAVALRRRTLRCRATASALWLANHRLWA